MMKVLGWKKEKDENRFAITAKESGIKVTFFYDTLEEFKAVMKAFETEPLVDVLIISGPRGYYGEL